MGLILKKESQEENLRILVVSQIPTESELEGYNLSNLFSLKMLLCFSLHKKRCSDASCL